MMTPIVTDTDITEKLLFVSNQYPTHEPPITDFHFGDLGEIVVLNLLASLARKELAASRICFADATARRLVLGGLLLSLLALLV